MIEEITISDLGVIASARLPLGPGFTALTGETGAGKTMVVTALGLLLGERADSGAIRSGSPQAVVEGRWLVAEDGPVAERVRDAGGDLDGGELILGRSLSSEGRSRALVGGRTAPVGVLAELGPQLVVVHGQSDQVRLRSATAQREALDRFAGDELAAVLAQYQETFRGWQQDRGELDVLVAEHDRRAAEADQLRAAIEQIEAVQPRRGEDTELAEQADRLGNLEELRLAASQAHELLATESDATDVQELLGQAHRLVERVAAHDGALGPIASSLADAVFAVSEVSAQLSGYLASLDADGPAALEGVHERRSAIAALVRQYGPTLDDVIDLLDTGSARLLELDQDDARIAQLTADVEAAQARVVELGAQLSELRRAAAGRLSGAVTAELSALAMPDASISVIVDDRADYSPSGKDAVSILLQPHAGAEPRPLGRGASGGELSRVMLAIEVVLAGTDPVPTFVFDEVDAGVGGAAAIEIGRRLARLAKASQVIVVTHLPQVAAFASNHLRVLKQSNRGDSEGGDSDSLVTASSVQQLDDQERLVELARMLSGLADSESGLAHARELIAAARAG